VVVQCHAKNIKKQDSQAHHHRRAGACAACIKNQSG